MTKRARAKRDALATAKPNLALVVSIARKIHETLPSSFCLADLIGEGNVALVEAAEKYDPAAHNGTPFSAYARQKIRGKILDSVGRRVETNGHSLNKYQANTCVSIDEHFEDRRKGRCTEGGPKRADEKPQNERERALARMAHQPTAPTAIDRARRSSQVEDAISWLPKSERSILSLLLSDDALWRDDGGPNLRAIARLLGITLDEAHRHHDSALTHLRARLNGGPLPRAA